MRARAFSLMDVLVTMAVVAVLISLLTPTLSSVRETAHQVICRSEVRQFGLGIHMFAEANKDLIPRSINIDELRPWDTFTLRFGDDRGQNSHQWDGLGRLYSDEYLLAPRLYYCPSHRGNHPYSAYQESWAGNPGTIAGNFQYRGAAPSTAQPPQKVRQLGQMNPNAALISDTLRSQSDFNHGVGANVLRAGLNVSWFRDESGSVADMLPKDGVPTATQLEFIWSTLDE